MIKHSLRLAVRLGMLLLVVAICAHFVNQIRVRVVRQPELVMMRSILNALYNYDSRFRKLPPAAHLASSGNPTCSWRVLVVPYYAADFTAYGFNVDIEKHWNEPPNDRLAKEWGRLFSFGDAQHTNLFAVTGPDTGFDSMKPHGLVELPEDLVLLAEVANSGVHWMEPGDFDVQNMPSSINGSGKCISSSDRHILVGFADGQVWLLRDSVPFETLSKFFTITGAKSADRDDLLRRYLIMNYGEPFPYPSSDP